MSDLASLRVSWTDATMPSAERHEALGSAGREGRWTVISVLLGERGFGLVVGGLGLGLGFDWGGGSPQPWRRRVSFYLSFCCGKLG